MPSLKSLLVWGFASVSPVLASRSKPREAIKETLELDTRAERTPKYFNEAGGGLELGHYDKRFFVEKVDYAQHRFVLRDLARSYITVMNSYGVETWMAHGTLLGWWWNGQIMPWDYDLDVQLTNTSMLWLGENLNRTEHVYNYTDTASGKLVTKSYLLDINPHHVDLDKGDGMNIIDARWIDKGNGMYIDMTVLREREADRPGVWSCKNKHRYNSQDLWPLRISEFEGVKTRIPFNFEKILIDEYKTKSLVTEEWSGHRWDRSIKQWVKMDAEEEKKAHQQAVERKKLELQLQAQRDQEAQPSAAEQVN
ncbi:LicD family-domain-containing protein [Dactylonectria macrodidyma]|uniref:LicD family-domain-containing protein n=1 Tax=Dactylonectria macrodidyma TaxID=307937 RepID=A0A9P9F6R2_9HYPO|nr:LicD family-domain-containing protein [Dactylonectria macrodidyma]